MTTLTQKPVSEGQIRQIVRVAADAAEKAVKDFFAANADVGSEDAQRIHARGNELADAISAVVGTTLPVLSHVNDYRDEEVRSTYGYLSGYKKPKDVAWQSNRLRELFHHVGYHDESLATMAVPDDMEGLFVFPRWQSIGKTYVDAVKVVFAKLEEIYGGAFYNYRADEMDAEHLRETAWKAEAMAKIAEQQKGYDLLVIPAQFGIIHRGRSVRRARAVIGTTGFGLGAFEVGIMLLLHPERLQHYDDLWIDAAGDEFKSSGAREFSLAPFFLFLFGGLKFASGRVDGALGRCGSASASLPQ